MVGARDERRPGIVDLERAAPTFYKDPCLGFAARGERATELHTPSLVVHAPDFKSIPHRLTPQFREVRVPRRARKVH
jgi:hypothetical protein